MADNTILNPGVGGDTVRNEDIGGVKYPVSKIYTGAEGVNGGPVTDANPLPVELQNASVAVTGAFYQATQPVSGTVTANPATGFGKAITFVAVSQGAAGTTVLAAASASNKHKILACALVMDAAGTLKFNDGTVDLTGAMSIAINGGFVLPSGFVPYTETAATNRPLNLITATGAAKGFVAILTEP